MKIIQNKMHCKNKRANITKVKLNSKYKTKSNLQKCKTETGNTINLRLANITNTSILKFSFFIL